MPAGPRVAGLKLYLKVRALLESDPKRVRRY